MSEVEAFWAVALLASLFVGASKGGLPMVAQLAVPTISLVMSPMQGAALLLPVYLISDAFGLWIYRRSYSLRNLFILIPAGALGVLIGYLLAGQTSDSVVRIAIGCVGLGFVGLRLRTRIFGPGEPRPADVPRGMVWGTICGFTSFVSHAGGPAFQAYTRPQQMPKMVYAGTATIFFAVINLIKVPPYLALDLLDIGDMRSALILTPMAILGTWLGFKVTVMIPERIFFIFIDIALFLISVNLIRIGLSG
jgi:uncharacterized membrane protein YfcA